MPTLQEYEDLIGKLERLEGFCPATTGYGGERLYGSDAEEAATLLRSLSTTIRSIAWSGPYQPHARELAGRAEASARRIAAEYNLIS